MPSSREMLGLYLAALYTGVIPIVVPTPPRSHTGIFHAAGIHWVAAATRAKSIFVKGSHWKAMARSIRGHDVRSRLASKLWKSKT